MDLLFFIIIVFLAGLVQGITGFGFALVATPIALTFLDKGVVVPTLIFISSFLNLFIIKKIPEKIDKKIFLPILLSSFLGMPLGLYILQTIKIDTFKIVTGSLSVLFTLAIYFSKIKLDNFRFFAPVAGFVSGLLQTSTGMSGPPVVLLLSSTDIAKDQFRKTLLIYFLTINIITLVIFTVVGLLTLEKISFATLSVPFALLAGYLGHKLAKIIPQSLFRIIVLASVCVTGLYAIYSGIKVQ